MTQVVSCIMIFQVVGSLRKIEINPREIMAKESSIVGVLLPRATEVKETYGISWNCFTM